MKTKLLLILLTVLQLNLNAQVAHDYKQGCCKLVGEINDIESCYCAGCADTEKKNKQAKEAEDKRIKELSVKKAEEERQKAIEKQKKENEKIVQQNKDAKANTLHYEMASSDKKKTVVETKKTGNEYKRVVIGDDFWCNNRINGHYQIFKNGKLTFETKQYKYLGIVDNNLGYLEAAENRGCNCDPITKENNSILLNHKGEQIRIDGISKFWIISSSNGVLSISVFDGSCTDTGRYTSRGIIEYEFNSINFKLISKKNSIFNDALCDCSNRSL